MKKSHVKIFIILNVLFLILWEFFFNLSLTQISMSIFLMIALILQYEKSKKERIKKEISGSDPD